MIKGNRHFGRRSTGGGVRLVTRDRKERWDIESTPFQGPNMVICKIVSRLQRTPLIGDYLPLTTLEHLTNLEDALNSFLWRDPIVLGDLNADG